MQNTKIEWADHTFNPWIGCTKVGPGCDNCYAEADFDKRRHVVQWGPNQPRKRTAASTWAAPLRWNREAAAAGVRHRVFCASLADVFDNEVPEQWRMDLFDLIQRTPNLDWLLLTKRIGNVGNMLPVPFDFDRLYQNVWIGATITSQYEADRDIRKLLEVPAAKRFLSMEPLLGPVDLTDVPMPGSGHGHHEFSPIITGNALNRPLSYPRLPTVDWVIVGGESGPGARPMSPDWARSLRDQCQAAGVPFMFKQFGEWREPLAGEEFDTSIGLAAKPPAFILSESGTVHCFKSELIVNGKVVIKVGKKAAGRLLDGREWNEVPA